MDSKKRIILIAGILGGLAAAIGVAFLNENFDHRIKRPDDIMRRLDLPSLVSVPLFGPGAGLLPDVTAIKNLVTIPERKLTGSRKAFASQDISREIRKYFEILMHRIVFSNKKENEMPHIFAFTSCRHREGVSTVAANFAVNVARIGRGRVLMVDMNLLKFDANASEEGPFPNLGNMIAVRRGNPSDSLPSPVDKLYMVEYARQGKSTELEDLQSMWRKEYEYVVMDLPPVFDDARVMTLARLADEVILVVEAERERWEVIRTARDMLVEAKANLIGIILNKRIFYIPGWLYKTL